MERGTLYLADGQAVLVKPINKKFELEELQLAVKGYVELVKPLDKASKLYVNEEGKIYNLPLNAHTQEILDQEAYGFPEVILGDALGVYHVKPSEAHDEARCLISEVRRKK